MVTAFLFLERRQVDRAFQLHRTECLANNNSDKSANNEDG